MSTRFVSKMLDYSKGILGGVSDYGRRPNYLSSADNVLLRPFGALQVRKGSQRSNSTALNKEPHTIMEHVGLDTIVRIFVGTKDAGSGKLYRMNSTTFTLQNTPFAIHASNRIVWDQLNDVLWAAQPGGNPPMFFASANPSETWHNAMLPRPSFPAIANGTVVTIVSSVPGGQTLPGGTTTTGCALGATTLTLSANAGGGVNGDCVLNFGGIIVPNCQLTNGAATCTYDGPGAAAQKPFTLTNGAAAGGALTVLTTYNYRLRYRYKNGSSLTSVVVTATATGAGLPQSIAVSNIANEVRSDYVGWTLERTKFGGDATGPWYVLADGTGTTYTDLKADGDLGARTDPDLKHGEPLAFEGIIAHRDRLFGWLGSTLYASQSIADLESTGICNWNALNGYEFGKDDGDSIQAVVRQNDRLVIFKKWSVWALEGFDPNSFLEVPIFTGAGAAGPRCAGAMGGRVWFFGDAGMHQLVGNEVTPFGWEQVGHIFDAMAKSRFSDVVVKNYLGQLVLVSFSTGGARNDAFLVYDQRFGGWTRFTNWYAQDILVQKGASFGDAQTILFADTRDFDAGGAHDYRVWLGFSGFKDEKAANGSGGANVRVQIVTPFIDDGSADATKIYERLQVFASAGLDTNLSLTLEVTPRPDSRSFSTLITQAGTKWGTLPQAHGSVPPTWGSFKWGQKADLAPYSGLRAGLTGSRYRVTATADCPGDFQFKGHAADVLLLPERRMS